MVYPWWGLSGFKSHPQYPEPHLEKLNLIKPLAIHSPEPHYYSPSPTREKILARRLLFGYFGSWAAVQQPPSSQQPWCGYPRKTPCIQKIHLQSPEPASLNEDRAGSTSKQTVACPATWIMDCPLTDSISPKHTFACLNPVFHPIWYFCMPMHFLGLPFLFFHYSVNVLY